MKVLRRQIVYLNAFAVASTRMLVPPADLALSKVKQIGVEVVQMRQTERHQIGWCLKIAFATIFLFGCESGPGRPGRVPEVSTRFTSTPVVLTEDGIAIPVPQEKQTRVGLAMQSSTSAAEISFAARLGTVLMRELQLCAGGFRVTPLAALELRATIPDLDTPDVTDVVTVSLQDPVDGLPPRLPPGPYLDSTMPAVVDQVLVVRAIEYRPYYPVLVTLDIKVLDAATQAELFSTTASWSGDDYLLRDDQCPPKKNWFRREPESQPAPGHNSPQALMHEIAKDVTSWYYETTNPSGGPPMTASDESSGAMQQPGPVYMQNQP
jgi:hypothetical protein